LGHFQGEFNGHVRSSSAIPARAPGLSTEDLKS
jgi:hypothetical protein